MSQCSSPSHWSFREQWPLRRPAWLSAEWLAVTCLPLMPLHSCSPQTTPSPPLGETGSSKFSLGFLCWTHLTSLPPFSSCTSLHLLSAHSGTILAVPPDHASTPSGQSCRQRDIIPGLLGFYLHSLPIRNTTVHRNLGCRGAATATAAAAAAATATTGPAGVAVDTGTTGRVGD